VPQYLYGYAQEPGVLADMIAQQLKVDIDKKQQALETSDVVTRLDTILAWMKAASPLP